MKRLLLLRHAKSSWDDPRLADFDRPLADRGVTSAGVMADHFVDQGLRPDFILCSAARRTRETLDLVQAAWDWSVPALIDPSLYEATADGLMAHIKGLPDRVETVLMIAHNPSIQNLAERLASRDSEPEALADMTRKFPTAALATLEADLGSWSKTDDRLFRLTAFTKPRDIAPH